MEYVIPILILSLFFAEARECDKIGGDWHYGEGCSIRLHEPNTKGLRLPKSLEDKE